MKEIKVGLATCGLAAGGEAVYKEIEKEIDEYRLDVTLKETGCMGMCYGEVLVEVTDDSGDYLYSRVTPEKAKRIIKDHVMENHPVGEWIIKGNGAGKVSESSLISQPAPSLK